VEAAKEEAPAAAPNPVVVAVKRLKMAMMIQMVIQPIVAAVE
jgi:hypothetical protein